MIIWGNPSILLFLPSFNMLGFWRSSSPTEIRVTLRNSIGLYFWRFLTKQNCHERLKREYWNILGWRKLLKYSYVLSILLVTVVSHFNLDISASLKLSIGRVNLYSHWIISCIIIQYVTVLVHCNSGNRTQTAMANPNDTIKINRPSNSISTYYRNQRKETQDRWWPTFYWINKKLFIFKPSAV